ncbi:hypothetical protein MTO96_037434 [Rhipicephalus appendiculatus]
MAVLKRPHQHTSSPAPCTPVDSETDKKCPGSPNHCACAFLCFIGGSVLIAGLLLYYLFLRALSESSRPDYLESLGCHRNDCFTSQGLLTETLNASIDPCLDFKKYVTFAMAAGPMRRRVGAVEVQVGRQVPLDAQGRPAYQRSSLRIVAREHGGVLLRGLREPVRRRRDRDPRNVQEAAANPRHSVARASDGRPRPV